MGLKETEIKGNQEVTGKAGKIDAALTEIKQKVDVAKYVWDEMGNLYQDFNKLSLSETFERFKGIFVMGALGMLMGKEEFEEWKMERKDIRVIPNENSTGNDLGEISNQELKYEKIPEALKRDRFVNMANATKEDYDVWYEVNGEKCKRGTRGAIKKWALNESGRKKDPKDVASELTVKMGSGWLFEKTPDTYQEFEDNLCKKLYPLETNRQKAIDKAAKFLSGCAVGRFQILPKFHFDKIGWTVKGKEGLQNMYKFIKDRNIQVQIFKPIVTENLKRYNNDPVAAAMAYYSGGADTYFKEKAAGNIIEANENGRKILKYKDGVPKTLTRDQRGGGSILAYANSAYRHIQESQEKGYGVFEQTAMAIEHIESSGGRYMNQIFAKKTGSNSSGEKILVTENKGKNLDNKVNKNESIISKKSEISQEKNIDQGMSQFIEEELKNKEGAKLWLENLEGNGGRSVLTYIPPGVDLKANNLTLIYQFHGTFSEQIIKPQEGLDERKKGWSRLNDTITAMDELARKGKNVILVYPLSAGPRDNTKYDNSWMAKGKKDREGNEVKDDFDRMHAEAIAQVGIKSNQISRIEVQGNSSGGKAMLNIAQSGTKLVNAYRFLDASFRGYAEGCYAASRKNGAPDLFLIVANTSKKTFPKNMHRLSEWGQKGLLEQGDKGQYSTKIDGLYYYESPLQHGDMVRNFTGWNPKEIA